MTNVVFIVGLCPDEASYQDLMFSNIHGWSIKNKVFGPLPKGTPYFITRWDHDFVTEINKQFPTGDLMIIGFSFGGGRVAQQIGKLGRNIKKLLLIDPVDPDHADHANTIGFSVPNNVLDAECWYRNAIAMPWSSYISNAFIGANSQTKVKNLLYTSKNSDPWAAHGEKVWSSDLVNIIKSNL